MNLARTFSFLLIAMMGFHDNAHAFDDGIDDISPPSMASFEANAESSQVTTDDLSFSVGDSDTELEDALSSELLEKPPLSTQAPREESDLAINAIVDSYNHPSQSRQHYLSEATLYGLNKITARAQPIKAKVGESTFFGNLEIFVRLCWQPSQISSNQESKALLEIWEHKPHQEKSRIYYAWMIAKRPSLSPLEHPVYDVTLSGCGAGSHQQ